MGVHMWSDGHVMRAVGDITPSSERSLYLTLSRAYPLAMSRAQISAIVPAKDALQVSPQVGNILRAHLHILMVTPLCPVRLSGPLCQPVQMPARLDVHHIVPSPLQHQSCTWP